ncbi:MAG TPA: hypothetical protein VM011_02970 [Gammaproteobacteria bacterium]|nr:hypothetical protein [Gammaproteobacteria bacterium]
MCGDNQHIARHVAEAVGIQVQRFITGRVLLILALPYLPFGRVFDFVPLPVLAAMLAITGFYRVVSEFTRRAFYRRFGGKGSGD